MPPLPCVPRQIPTYPLSGSVWTEFLIFDSFWNWFQTWHHGLTKPSSVPESGICMRVLDGWLYELWRYYSGQKKAALTIVIGGNHSEGTNCFWELCLCLFSPPQPNDKVVHIRRYHGGWLAPNVYFLGHAGCVQVNGIRIAGMSGIYKAGDYWLGTFFSFFCHSEKLADARKGYYERLPYDQRSMRSIYHTRRYNVNRFA